MSRLGACGALFVLAAFGSTACAGELADGSEETELESVGSTSEAQSQCLCMDFRGVSLTGSGSCGVGTKLTAKITYNNSSQSSSPPEIVYIDILKDGQPVATFSGWSSYGHPFIADYTVKVPGSYKAVGRDATGAPFPYYPNSTVQTCGGTTTERCALDFYDHAGKYVDASWDTANCYIQPLPEGVLGFVYNESTSVYTKRQYCSAGRFDSANCYIFSPPTGSTTFIYEGAFYYTPKAGPQKCDAPASFDGVNCYVMPVPAGATPFVWANNGYVAPSTGCHPSLSAKDQGNRCYLGKVPAGTSPFVWSTNLYYAE